MLTLIIPTLMQQTSLACLRTLSSWSCKPDTTIVVHSAAGGADTETIDGVVHLRRPTNEGFAAAVNAGLAGRGDDGDVALLNDDTQPDPEWLAHATSLLAEDTRLGAVASRIMFLSRPDIVASAGIRMDASAAPWDLGVGNTSWPQTPIDTFGASGGACLLRGEMLQDVGHLEESFFAYLEDADLAWRMRLRGWTARLAPRSTVLHSVSATAGEGSPFKRYLLARNKWRMIVRCYPSEGLLQNLASIIAYDLISCVHSLRRKDAVPLHGRLDAFKGMPLLIAQRKRIQATRTTPWCAIEKALSPLESPLAVYRKAAIIAKLASKPRADGPTGR